MKGNINEIKLTDDPLTNILIMTPFLDESDKAVVNSFLSGLIVGIGSKKAKGESNNNNG